MYICFLLKIFLPSVKSPSADLTWQKGAKRQMANLERYKKVLISKEQIKNFSCLWIKKNDPKFSVQSIWWKQIKMEREIQPFALKPIMIKWELRTLVLKAILPAYFRFIEELLSFDDNQLPEATLLLVEPYLKKPSFDPEAMERKTSNSACGALCKWVIGVVRYHRMMISKVKPLHQKVEETTTSVDEAEHKMATLENKRKVKIFIIW